MTTTPSTFGSPAEAPAPPLQLEQPASRRPSTLVLAVGAGVVALGILGGAAALVLAPGDEAAAPAVPPAEVPVAAPSTDAVEEPDEPLPTAASRGRNIFVPLIATKTDQEAEADPSAGPVDPGGAPGDTPVVPVPLDSPVISVGGSGGSLPVVRGTGSVPASSSELQAAKDQVAQLQTQIAQLQAQLVSASDDTALKQQISTLTTQRDSLSQLVGTLQEQVDGYEDTDASRLLLDVTSADGATLTVSVDGTEYPVGLGDSVQVSSTSAGVPLSVTYVSFDDVADPGPDEVRLTYVDATYSASVGATLVLPR